MSRVTIMDVARRAGVSPTAVSFAFNSPSRLGSGTVARILAVAGELGYAPNPHAKALHARRTGVLGVLVPQAISEVFSNPFFGAFLQGVGVACDERGLSLLVVPPFEGSLEKAVARAPVDGFVVLGINEGHREVAPLHRRGVPYVVVDGEAEGAPSVNVDDEGGAYEAAAYLLGRGHRRVEILTFPALPRWPEGSCHGVGGRRRLGFRRAFEEHGLAWEEDGLVPALCTEEGGERGFDTAWQAGRRPTAVLTVSDVQAFGVLRAAGRKGLRVPDELEVLGFDDVPLAAVVGLSTVRQPVSEKGRLAAGLLVSLLEDGGGRERVLLPTELVLRRTTR